METHISHRKEPTDTLPYFLAGHSAPAGVYREMQTGRDLRLEVEGVLPATYDGHVAVYVRLPLTWAELRRPIEEVLV